MAVQTQPTPHQSPKSTAPQPACSMCSTALLPLMYAMQMWQNCSMVKHTPESWLNWPAQQSVSNPYPVSKQYCLPLIHHSQQSPVQHQRLSSLEKTIQEQSAGMKPTALNSHQHSRHLTPLLHSTPSDWLLPSCLSQTAPVNCTQQQLPVHHWM